MTKKEEAYQLAKSIATIEARIDELKAERERLMEQFGAFFGESETNVIKTAEGDDSPAAIKSSARRDTPSAVIELLASYPDKVFTPMELAHRLGLDSKRVRNALYRFSITGDPRVMKIGSRGAYRFGGVGKDVSMR
jgi:predicted Rossmann fold nucleotide-binding protein DprA/Smf involved in DNA uptake